MNIKLHLGAHKTATTYLQTLLKDNLELLSQAGISYIPLEDMRKHFMPALFHDKDTVDQCSLSEWLSNKAAPNEVLIMSEENLIGWPSELKQKLYNNAETRLKAFKQSIGDHAVSDIYITIRDFAPFFQSCYLESQRNNNFPLEAVNYQYLSRFSWLSLIASIERVFPEASIHVLEYERFKVALQNLLASLLGAEALNALVFYDRPVRPSLNQDLIPVFQSIYNLDIPQPAKNELKKALKRKSNVLPKSLKNYLFDQAVIEQMHGRYKKEVRELVNRYDVIGY